MHTTERTARHAAALWAAALLVSRPDETIEEQEALVTALDDVRKETGANDLWSALWAALERDDEDTDETVQRVFRALAEEPKTTFVI